MQPFTAKCTKEVGFRRGGILDGEQQLIKKGLVLAPSEQFSQASYAEGAL